jgi:(1->4)-alpha-D-glucan 1-alpha-D-glucosylmutase
MLTRRIPTATYRLQFNKNFTFQNACAILDYLSELGISDIYASPILTSRRGSGHGYDVTDPTRIDADLGSEADFEAFQQELQNHDMGLLLDIVPNHMAASHENPWWMDVLANGPESPFASYFDIDWHPPSQNMENKILLPVLGRPFGEVLDGRELKLTYEDGRFFVQYFESLFPLAPKSYRQLLQHRIDTLKIMLGEASEQFQDYAGIISALSAFSERNAASHLSAADRHSNFEAVRERLWHLLNASGVIADFVDSNLADYNGKEGDSGSLGNLEGLLGEQYYALAYWQNVNDTINYRRFFTITNLVGIRVEDPLVFDATHSLILRLIPKGVFVGFRVDHIDGLRDPLAYLTRLQERITSAESPTKAAHGYVLVEKILARSERLPSDWPVSGTTGYDYLNYMNGIFVHPQGAKHIENIYSAFIGKTLKFEDVLLQKKDLVMNILLAVEMRSLGRQLGELAGQDRYARDLSRRELTDALLEVTACLSVYRTYIRNLDVPEDAKQFIGAALEIARVRKPRVNPDCFGFLRDVLMLLNPPHVHSAQREARLNFVLRWQQFTGPIVAKGLEDTALYVYHPLLSLNDVGGNPQPDGISLEAFHEFIVQRQEHWPHTLNATSTHDTKRAEDVRARINILSETPEEWQNHLGQWAKENASHKFNVDSQLVPDPNEEYFLYQTLLGAWPLNHAALPELAPRLKAYVVKATREAMVHTRWTRPNLQHEEAFTRFVDAILNERLSERFLIDFRSFQEQVAFYGMLNSLSQTLLKITCPGVPDFYQGAELWDYRLVDPDNRGPVDFAERIALLARMKATCRNESIEVAQELVRNWADGSIKLYCIWKALTFRKKNAALFSHGQFEPVTATGGRAENVLGFLRKQERNSALIIVPRWLRKTNARLAWNGKDSYWDDTHIRLSPDAPDAWRNIFTGEEIEVETRNDHPVLTLRGLVGYFPVGLFEAASRS